MTQFNEQSQFLNYCNNSFQKILENPNIDAKDVRKRQGFQFLINNESWFILNYDYYKNKRVSIIWNDLKKIEPLNSNFKLFVGVKLSSIDGYKIAKINKPTTEKNNNRYLANILASFNSELISDSSENVYFLFLENKDSKQNKRNVVLNFSLKEKVINLFDGRDSITIEMFNQDENSLINNEKYFAKVNQLNGAISLNYDECLKLVQKVEEELRESKGNSLSTGF